MDAVFCPAEVEARVGGRPWIGDLHRAIAPSGCLESPVVIDDTDLRTSRARQPECCDAGEMAHPAHLSKQTKQPVIAALPADPLILLYHHKFNRLTGMSLGVVTGRVKAET